MKKKLFFINQLTLYEVIIIFLPLLLYIMIYDKLPLEIPVHFGINGNPDKFAYKWSLLAIISPLYGVVGFTLGKITHKIVWNSVRNNKNKLLIDKMMVYAEIVQIVLFTVLSIIFTKAISNISNFAILEIIRLHLTACSIICIIVGNFMPKLYKNDTTGIITPYSISSNQIWIKVHRYCGKIFVITGIVCLLINIYYQIPDSIAIFLNIIFFYFMLTYIVNQSKGIMNTEE